MAKQSRNLFEATLKKMVANALKQYSRSFPFATSQQKSDFKDALKAVIDEAFAD